ncbi:MAG: DUF4923 family protein [Bacteroidales bacterium]|nr:DUF4923 family protein [Bacteroidales bacterium]
MKKSLSLISAAICSLSVLCSCGILTQSGTSSQTNQSSQTTSSQTTQGKQTKSGSIMDVLSGVGDIISKTLGITTTDIVGVWTYQEPAVLFESDDMLTKAGGQVAAQKVAQTLDGYYQKVGITPGKMKMSFDKNGNFTQSIGGKTLSGTYTLENGNINLVYSGGVQQIIGTTQFEGNNLVVVVDVTKLLNAVKSLSGYTNNAAISTIAALAANFNGMKAGFRFSK